MVTWSDNCNSIDSWDIISCLNTIPISDGESLSIEPVLYSKGLQEYHAEIEKYLTIKGDSEVSFNVSFPDREFTGTTTSQLFFGLTTDSMSFIGLGFSQASNGTIHIAYGYQGDILIPVMTEIAAPYNGTLRFSKVENTLSIYLGSDLVAYATYPSPFFYTSINLYWSGAFDTVPADIPADIPVNSTMDIKLKAVVSQEEKINGINIIADSISLTELKGTGIINDPYLISSPEELFSIRKFKTKNFYKQTADISLIDYANWAPIGTSEKQFSGYFLGENHKITDLNINRPTENYIGLFGYVKTFEIKDLEVTGSIVGLANVGILIGYGYRYCTVTNCNSLGTVTGALTGEGIIGGLAGKLDGGIKFCHSDAVVEGYTMVGGLVGYLDTDASDCYATGNVIGHFNNVGGLFGQAAENIKRCYATGEVVGYGDNIGGFVGYGLYAYMDNCYAIGKVTGAGNVGGFVGNDKSYSTAQELQNCYSTGDVYIGAQTGTKNIGGFIGALTERANMKNCYSTGNVHTLPGLTLLKAGGFMGSCESLTTTDNCYSSGNIFNPENCNVAKGFVANKLGPVVGCYFDVTKCPLTDVAALPKITNDMYLQATYLNWDFTTIWEIAGNYPTIRATAKTTIPFSGAGLGTELSPYLVSTAGELNEIRNNMTAHYRQTADIDLLPDYPNWVPIEDALVWNIYFTGVYDGDGFTIDNMTINCPDMSLNGVGLFSYTYLAILKNITLTNVNISAPSLNTGVLCGDAYWTEISNISIQGNTEGSETSGLLAYCEFCVIDNCKINIIIDAGDDVSGITNYLENGIISNCTVSGTMTSYDGDICGITNFGENVTIINCNVNATITGSRNASGIADSIYSGRIDNCHFVGTLTGRCANGLLDYFDETSVNNCTVKATLRSYHFIAGLFDYIELSKTVSNCSANIIVESFLEVGKTTGTIGIYGLIGDLDFESEINDYTLGIVENCSVNMTIVSRPEVTGTVTGGFGWPDMYQFGKVKIINCHTNFTIDTPDIYKIYGFANKATGAYNSTVEITNCYSTGNIPDKDDNFSFMEGITLLSVTGCYFDQTLSPKADSYATGKTTEQMKQQDTFTNWDFSIWNIKNDINSGYPHLSPQLDFAGGSGTKAYPYLIANSKHLNNVRKFLNAHYLQIQDVDIYTYNNWICLGNETTAFTGSYDGGNYDISNLIITSEATSTLNGLFGVTKKADIKNINLTSVSIHNDNAAALIVDMTDGIVNNCSSAGTIALNKEGIGGGLIGKIKITGSEDVVISNCMSSIDLTSTNVFSVNSTIGGLLSQLVTNGSQIPKGMILIDNCHASGDVSGPAWASTSRTNKANFIGGFIGKANSDAETEFFKCYATGNVKGNMAIGGFVGSISKGLVTNCYSLGNVDLCSGWSSTYNDSNNAYNIGSFAGEVKTSAAKVSSCYSSGSMNLNGYKVANIYNRNGFIGYSSGQSGRNLNHYDKTKAVLSDVLAIANTTAELLNQDTYLDWDFEDIWIINAISNSGLPYFNAFDFVAPDTDPGDQTSTLNTKINIKEVIEQEVQSYTDVKKLVTLTTAKRHTIRLDGIKAEKNQYAQENVFRSRELITAPVKSIAIFCNEYIPEHFPAGTYFEYFLTINGKDYNIVPISSLRAGKKIVRTTDYSKDSEYVEYLSEDIKSAFLTVRVHAPNMNETPYISNLKILIGGNDSDI